MIPNIPSDMNLPTPADDTRPRFFLDDSYDATTDSDWWLDLGHVDLPVQQAV